MFRFLQPLLPLLLLLLPLTSPTPTFSDLSHLASQGYSIPTLLSSIPNSTHSQLLAEALAALAPPPSPPLPTPTPTPTPTTTCPPCSPALNATLLSFYHAIRGNSTWYLWENSATDCFTWDGVEHAGAYAYDDLDDCALVLTPTAQLVGRLPDDFLDRIIALYPRGFEIRLGYNPRLSGVLPRVLRVPPNSLVRLYGTQISGPLPQVLELGAGSRLSLYNSAITGEFRGEAITLGRGSTLDLSQTKLSGELPQDLPTHTSLFLDNTLISGELPSPLDLHNITLRLSGSSISGSFPSELIITGDSELIISATHISGTLASTWTSRSPGLFKLDVSGLVDLSGTLPEQLPDSLTAEFRIGASSIGGTVSAKLASQLLLLHASNSYLVGTLPPFPRAVELACDSCFVSGAIPYVQGSSTWSSGVLSLSNTFISSSLPEWLFSSSFNTVRLAHCNLTGAIPYVPSMSSLVVLDLQDNAISSTLPSSLWRHPLRILNLGGNHGISGMLFDFLRQPLHLQRLDLRDTSITSVSPVIFSSPTMLEVNLAGTPVELDTAPDFHSGSPSRLCEAFGRASSLRHLDLSGVLSLKKHPISLSTYMQCFLSAETLTSLTVRDVPVKQETCREYHDFRLVRSYACNVVRYSRTLQALDLSGTGLVKLRTTSRVWRSDLNQARELRDTDFPSLQTLDVSSNPDLEGTVPNMFAQLYDLDISYTNYDLCASRPIFGSQLYRLSVRGLHAPWSKCFPLILDDVGLLWQDVQLLSDPERDVECPQWRLTNAVRGGFVNADTTFLDFYRCNCSSGDAYFGRHPAYSVSSESWEQYRNPVALYNASVFRCWSCPHGSSTASHLACDLAAGPDRAPRHTLLGSLYPLYEREPGDWIALTDRWRLPHAALASCQHTQVCNVDKDSSHIECRTGHDPNSLLCSKCQPGYFRVGLLCQKCPAHARVLIATTTILALIALGGYFSWIDFARPGIVLSMFFFWLQLEGILQRVNQQLEAQDSDARSTANDGFFAPVQGVFSSLSTFHPYALQCASRSADFEVQTQLLLTSPLTTLVFVAVVFFVTRLYIDGTIRGALSHPSRSYRKWVTVVLFLWSIVLFPITHRVLSVLSCADVDTVGESRHVDVSYLSIAPWIECGSRAHVNLVILGVIVLLLFIVPLIVYFWLEARRSHTNPEPCEPEESGLEMYVLLDSHTRDGAQPVPSTPTTSYAVFLTASVRPRVWWWPVLVQHGRAICLSVVIAFLEFRSAFLPLCIFLILLLSALVHVRVQPYRRTTDNVFEMIVLVSALVRYMLSMLAGLETLTSSVSQFSSTLSVFVTLSAAWAISTRLRERLANWCNL